MPRAAAGGGRVVWDHGSSAGSDQDGVAVEQASGATDSVFKRYLSELQLDEAGCVDALFEGGLARVRGYMAATSTAASACLICLGTVRPTEAVWSCADGCHATLHMQCMQEWAKSQIAAHVLQTMNRLSQFPVAAEEARATAEWSCPKCRQPYSAKAVPTTYWCFCGRAADPEWDPWRTPHSCGEVCGKPLGRGLPAAALPAGGGGQQGDPALQAGGCDHTCLLLCHPGPCPPCPLVVDAVCFCGAARDRRRCGRHAWSCGAPCGRPLECGHACQQPCHLGHCPPCNLVSSTACRCGQETRSVTCSQRDFQCSRPCRKQLDCGKHVCERGCHAGPCGPCPAAGAKTCPCGKQAFPGLACTDKPPSCGGTCDRLLPCGQHRCQDRCHVGECSVCREVVLKLCRCGKTQKAVGCSVELLCERRCNNLRSCGRHPCKRRCCDGTGCPPCEEVCGRKLRCGNHRCPAPCHAGPCRPCVLTVEFGCACGKLRTALPCGAEGRAVPPRCHAPCPVPPTCRHAATELARKPHRCHFGPCPPCGQACGTKLPCGHVCASSACHDPPRPPVAAFTAPPPPKAPVMDGNGANEAAPGHPQRTGVPAPAMSRRAERRAAKAGPPTEPNNGSPRLQDLAGLPLSLQTARVAAQALLHGGEGRAAALLSPCPPCAIPVAVSCLGLHEQRQVPCHEARPFSCGGACGAPLSCGNHHCSLPCHVRVGSPARPAGGATPCQQCTRACEVPRACGHACGRPCHQGLCAPCMEPIRAPCRCGKTSLTLPCATFRERSDLDAAVNREGSAAAGDVLSCGKPCHLPLPACPHPCRALCHAGPCTGVAACEEEVTVRCPCKRVKARWRCHAVRAALVAQGKPGTFDDTTPLRLLPCGPDCKQGPAVTAPPLAPPAPMNTLSPGVPPAQAQQQRMPTSPPPGKSGNNEPRQQQPQQQPAVPTGSERRSRQTKAERKAEEAARREAERAAMVRRQRIKSAIVWTVIVLVGLLLGLYGPQLLARLDEWAHQAWKPPPLRVNKPAGTRAKPGVKRPRR